MWKLIIVEDEPLVRRTIRNKVDWEKLGFEIVGEAENGEDALQLIRESDPDLVIADIVMPLMDGIELLKTIRTEGRECRFLMLTCMNEFEYARQALEYGASAYVLKASMDMDSLADALFKIKRELESRTVIHELQARTKLYAYEQSLPKVWDSLFAFPSTEQGAGRERPVMETIPGAEYVWIGVFLCGSPDRCLDEVKRHGFSPSERFVGMSAYCRSGVSSVFAFADRPLKWNGPSAGAVSGSQVSAGVDAIDSPDEPYGGVFTRAVPVSELPQVWAKLLQAVDKLWYENRRIMQYEDLRAHPQSPELPLLPWSYEKKLLREFEQSKREACMKTLESMWEELRRLQYPLVLVKSSMLHLDQVLARIAGRSSIPAREWMEAASFVELKSLFVQRLSLYMQHHTSSEEIMTDHEEVNKMIHYIRQNYDAPITLKSLSRYVSMEEHYVSRLFKKKVGVSLIHYMQIYRVEKAKVYLTETDMIVGDVGRNVGFANDNYFNKIFKRTAGLTPSEYRKRYQTEMSAQ